MIHKDLNLFAAMKKSSNRPNSSMTGIILIIVSFALVVGLTFGGLFFLTSTTESKVKHIQNEMAGEDIKKEQQAFLLLSSENSRLRAYLTGVREAKRRFEEVPKIDQKILDAVASSLPADTRITSMSIAPPSVQFSCISAGELSPAALQKTLLKKGIFSAVSYSGIAPASGGGYSFTMSCVLDYEALQPKEK